MVDPIAPASVAEVPVECWIEAIGVPAATVSAVARGLRVLGVRVRPRDAPDPAPNGVVVFATMTAQVADLIAEVTTDRCVRIVAVSTSPSPPGAAGWGLLRAGASDVCSWRDPARSARHVADRLRRWRTIDELVRCPLVQDFLVGPGPAWQAVLREAVEIAHFTDAAVLITGESGTGKERVAQLIHELDPRPRKGKLVVLDCSTVVASLSGSEFFGHEKGAYTGASTAREGAFELADGGTLFLDEVGELSVPLQAELLRVVQEGTFKRVGSNMWRRSSFRLVCATNRDVQTEQASGRFRRDFYHRIAGATLALPSLRERGDDIIPLFRHFFGQVHPDGELPELDDAVRDLLLTRAYPGNVRDLRSLVLRIAHRHLGSDVITPGDVPEGERPGEPVPWSTTDGLDRGVGRLLDGGATLAEITAAAADAAMRTALEQERGRVARAALRLGIPLATMEDWQRTVQQCAPSESPWRGGVHGSS